MGIGEIGWGKFEYDGVNSIFFQGLVRIGTLFFFRVCIFYPVPTHYKMRWRRSKTIQDGVRVAARCPCIYSYLCIYLRRYHFPNIFLIWNHWSILLFQSMKGNKHINRSQDLLSLTKTPFLSHFIVTLILPSIIHGWLVGWTRKKPGQCPPKSSGRLKLCTNMVSLQWIPKVMPCNWRRWATPKHTGGGPGSREKHTQNWHHFF